MIQDIPKNFRMKEPWIEQGAKVSLPGNKTGIITSFHESLMRIAPNKSGLFVHSVNIHVDGLHRPFPFNAWDMDPVKS